MSDSSTGLKPVIEEPSKATPFSRASSRRSAPTLKDFSWPRMSVNQKRRKRMSRSCMIARTSSAVRGCWSSALKTRNLPLERRPTGPGSLARQYRALIRSVLLSPI
jgi:hypothetical protein